MVEITERNNFCRVFEMPDQFPKDYCFAGGHPTEFILVDWFKPIPADHIWNNTLQSWEVYEEMIRDFWKKKAFFDSSKKYLVITNFGKAFLI